MKSKQKLQIRSETVGELNKKVKDLRLRLAKVQSERYTKQPKNTRIARAIRKELSIILTIYREKQLNQEDTKNGN